MPYPYTPPGFLRNQSAVEIHRRMLNALPPGIDKSEAQIPWDYTRPAALEKAEFVEFELNETIKLMFPLWAYGMWLDLHAQGDGLARRPANKASGYVTIRALLNVVIPAGFQVATPATLTSSIVFETTEEVTFDAPVDSNGQVTKEVLIQAVEGGRIGNVPEKAIALMVKPLTGIVYLANEEAITGGTDEENDVSLRERIFDVKRRGSSYTGCDAD